MERIEADLALGQSGELVPELAALVKANPFQERLRGQLMLALYRADRQAEALQVYRTTRRLLNDELGLEPSRALQALERSILQQDASLTAKGRRSLSAPSKGLRRSALLMRLNFSAASESSRAHRATRGGRLCRGARPVWKRQVLDHPGGPVARASRGALPGVPHDPSVLIRPGPTRLPPIGDGPVVLAVDQLEEVFTLCTDEGRRVAFLDELARRHAARRSAPRGRRAAGGLLRSACGTRRARAAGRPKSRPHRSEDPARSSCARSSSRRSAPD